jgi:hypothetical protein
MLLRQQLRQDQPIEVTEGAHLALECQELLNRATGVLAGEREVPHGGGGGVSCTNSIVGGRAL